jgi:hypothetical protein
MKPFSSQRSLAVRWIAVLLAALTFSTSQAIQFSSVPSWIKVFVTGKLNETGYIDVDAAGNTYLWYKAKQDTDIYRLGRIAVNGDVIVSPYSSFSNTDVDSFTKQPLIAPDGYIYVVVYTTDGNYNRSTWIGKYDTRMNQIWNRTFHIANTNFELKGLDVDKLGNVYILLRRGPSDEVQELELVQLNASNALTNVKVNTELDPSNPAFHLGTTWVASGRDLSTAAIRNGWGVFDQASAARLGGESGPVEYTHDYVHNTNNGVSHQYLVNAAPGGNIFVVHNTFTFMNTLDPTSYGYTVSCFSGAPGLQWASPAFTGTADRAWSPGVGLPSDVALYTPVPGYAVQQLSKTGSQNWLRPINAISAEITFDPNCILTVTKNVDTDKITATCYSTDLLSTQWTTTYGGVPVDGTAVIYGDVPVFRNNALYIASMLMNSYGLDNIDVRRYVTVPALDSVAGNNGITSVKSGGTISVKVALTQAAATGGLLVNLKSSSPSLVFSNNTQAISVPVYAGSLYAYTTMHTVGTVTASTAVTITATQGTLTRTAALTVIP